MSGREQRVHVFMRTYLCTIISPVQLAGVSGDSPPWPLSAREHHHHISQIIRFLLIFCRVIKHHLNMTNNIVFVLLNYTIEVYFASSSNSLVAKNTSHWYMRLLSYIKETLLFFLIQTSLTTFKTSSQDCRWPKRQDFFLEKSNTIGF